MRQGAHIVFTALLPQISDHQQSYGYEEGPLKGPGPRSAGDG